MTVDSVETFRHGAFWRDRLKVVTFFITLKTCIFSGASFELIKNLATLNPEKLQGFHGTPLYHWYTLAFGMGTRKCSWMEKSLYVDGNVFIYIKQLDDCSTDATLYKKQGGVCAMATS